MTREKNIKAFEYGLTGVSVERTLIWCLDNGCQYLSFVVPAEKRATKYVVHRRYRSIVKKVTDNNQEAIVATKAWAGTRIFSEIPMLCVISSLSADLIERVVTLSDSFTDWDSFGAVPLPQDIAAFSGKEPLPKMFTTSNEDLMVCLERHPSATLRKVTDGEISRIARRYGIPPGPHFCDPME